MNTNIPRICLNMIVKDEEHVITETLDSIRPYICYWVISDTGSTDATKDVITNYFEKHNIPGNLYDDKWSDFGTNRTIALDEASRHAPGNFDYIWVIDADDLVVGTPQFPQNKSPDMFNLSFTENGNTNFKYLRPQLVNVRHKWRYCGVLHEYIDAYVEIPQKSDTTESSSTKSKIKPRKSAKERMKEKLDAKNAVVSPPSKFKMVSIQNKTVELLQGCTIQSRRMGSRSKDADKYKKDKHVFLKALETETDPGLLTRYYFYLARSCVDCGDYADAIKYYRIRIKRGGWIEEKYYSLLEIARCKKRLEKSYDEIVDAYYDTFTIYRGSDGKFSASNKRVEGLYEMCVYMIGDQGKKANAGDVDWKLIYDRTADGLDAKFDPNYLFCTKPPFDYGIREMHAKAAYNLGYYTRAYDLYSELCVDTIIPYHLPNGVNLHDALVHYRNLAAAKIKDDFCKYPAAKIAELTKVAEASETPTNVTFSITSCKRFDLFHKTVNSFINCCTDVHKIDRWLCVDDNSSEADRQKMKKLYPFFEFIWKTPAQKGHPESMNMILEAVDSPYLLHMEDDFHFVTKRNYVQESMDILSKNPKLGQILFNRNYAEDFDDISIPGGLYVFDDDNATPDMSSQRPLYVIHEHYQPGTPQYHEFHKNHPNRGTNVYWPYYSLRPSMINTRIFGDLGCYPQNVVHFELIFARKYKEAGWVSGFFDDISCLHIGKTTKEKNSEKRNAYQLNDENQFSDRKKQNGVNVDNDAIISKFGGASNNRKSMPLVPTEIEEIDDDDFEFYYYKDTIGGDIEFISAASSDIATMKQKCMATSNCVGFNTLGYYKHTICDESQLVTVNYAQLGDNHGNKCGLYVYIPRLAQKLTERINKLNASRSHEVTFVITSCKRLGLFKRTMNSFLTYCDDAETAITRWVCIDDNSSEADRQEMKKLYPFFEFVWKTPAQKGHPRSLNMLLDSINTRYVLHYEDDWICTHNFKIKEFLNTLESGKADQIVFYPKKGAHREIDAIGGFKTWEYLYNKDSPVKPELNKQYDMEHINSRYYDDDDSEKMNINHGWWWPGFSLNPGIADFHKIKKVGKFDEEIRRELFEYEYALRLHKNGFKVAFVNLVDHIGWDNSAYVLNDDAREYDRR